MWREKKQLEPDEPPGAPEWLVTFSDCMTLLLTFFVLLLSFSSFDPEVFEKLETIFSGALPSLALAEMPSKDAFLLRRQIDSSRNVDQGSENPTSEIGKEDGLKEETTPLDFRGHKVFVVSSEEVFWGRGTTVSRQGHEVLSAVGAFLRYMPGRVVVSENGPGDASNKHFGLPRAWAVVEYLANQGMDEKRFSISASTTLPQLLAPASGRGTPAERRGLTAGGPHENGGTRRLEIVLLERSIYN